jgi:hypothetical protein
MMGGWGLGLSEDDVMSNSNFRRAGLALLFCLAASATQADDDEPLDARILAILNEATMIDFSEVPLDDAVEYFDDFHRKVKFDIDHDAITKAKIDLVRLGLTYKSPVEKNGAETTSTFPLYAALWQLLEPHNLSFMVKDGKIVFTTAKAAEKWQKKFKDHVATRK